MTDLASWLLAQIADDEAAARAATPGEWVAVGTEFPYEGADASEMIRGYVDVWSGPTIHEGEISGPDAYHIARHDPARVLAECAAKRAIVAEHPRYDDIEPCCETCGSYDGAGSLIGEWPCQTLRLLAQPYADRPGFDPAWKVET